MHLHMGQAPVCHLHLTSSPLETWGQLLPEILLALGMWWETVICISYPSLCNKSPQRTVNTDYMACDCGPGILELLYWVLSGLGGGSVVSHEVPVIRGLVWGLRLCFQGGPRMGLASRSCCWWEASAPRCRLLPHGSWLPPEEAVPA